MKGNGAKLELKVHTKELAIHYMKTLAEVAREALVILDADFRVILVNLMFYQRFRVSPEQTENKLLFKLGNGQWNIPALKKLLEEILPGKKIVKDYMVEHVFETIGEKTMLLNARQVDSVQLIILAIEDITTRRVLEKNWLDIPGGLRQRWPNEPQSSKSG